MNRYRHEYKYILDMCQENILQIRIAGIMQRDSHTNNDGMYTVRSLYFDDYNDSCYFENESGTDIRSKFRIRYYEDNIDIIVLEKKSKCHGMTMKESCRISEEECTMLIEDKVIEVQEGMSAVKKKLLLELKKRMLKPKVIVTYDRIPFVYEAGNVRVTFDQNITSSNDISNFLKADYRQRPIMANGKSVLEVKWDELLPLHIKEMLQLDTLQWNSFSKYYMSREYHL